MLKYEKDVSFYNQYGQEIHEANIRALQCPMEMGEAGDLELLYQFAEFCKAKNVIETGVAYGWSSLAFLLSLNNRTDGLLISTDLPYSEETKPYVGCIVPDHLRTSWEIIQKPDRMAIDEALAIAPEIDMCHYDSDKSYDGRMFAYPKLWEALRPGGIFVSDDIGDNLAFRNFAREVRKDPIIVRGGQHPRKFVGLLIK